jgi:hypothetical protein
MEPLQEYGLRQEALRAAGLAFVVSRIVLAVVTGIVAAVARIFPSSSWNRWDSVWYLGIARHGYRWINPGHYASHFAGSALAFFPAFPALLRGAIAGGIPGSVAGLLVANLAFLGALIYVYLLLVGAWGAENAGRALLLLALFPTAFFFAAPYTESLFLLAAAATLYHCRQQQALLAGLWLALAALTRSTAVILVMPALLLLRPRDLHSWAALFVPSAAAWSGYLLYLHAEGIPLAALAAAQHAWHRGLTLPSTGFIATVEWLARHAFSNAIAFESVGGLVVTVSFLAITVRAWPDLTVPMRAYCLGFWVLVLCTPEWLNGYPAPFSSVDRFILVLFPLAGWAAARMDETLFRRVSVVSAALMAALAAVHLTGGWIG